MNAKTLAEIVLLFLEKGEMHVRRKFDVDKKTLVWLVDYFKDNAHKVFESLDGISVKLRLKKNNTIPFKDIKFVKSAGNYAKIYTADGESHIFRLNLKDIYKQVKNEELILVHRSYLVNMLYVSVVKNRSLVIETNINIPVSKHKVREVKVLFAQKGNVKKKD